VSEILPLELKKEIAPPFPILTEFDCEIATDGELSRVILPLEAEKDIAPASPALPEPNSARD
jgi:hypothetical protein